MFAERIVGEILITVGNKPVLYQANKFLEKAVNADSIDSLN